MDFKALPTSASIAQPILPAFRIRRPVALAIARDNNDNCTFEKVAAVSTLGLLDEYYPIKVDQVLYPHY